MLEKNLSQLEKFRYSEKVGEFLSAMFRRFNEAGVCYCVLNSYEQLPEFTASDVDMAIDKVGLKKVESIIFDLAETMGFKVINKLYYDVPLCYYYILSFRDADGQPGFIQLDFMNDEMGIGRYFLKTSCLLAGRRKFKQFYIPSLVMEACYLFIKKIVKQTLLPAHEEKLRHLLNQDRNEINRLLEPYFGSKNLPDIEILIQGKDYREQAKLLKTLKQAITIRHRICMPHLVAFKFLWLGNRILQRINQPTGLVVALLSPDGGGKSTIADQILKRLRYGFRNTRRMHWRPYLLPPPRKILWPRKWREAELPNDDPHALPPKNRFISFLRFIYYLADYILGFFPKILWPKIRTNLVVMQRYYYDFLIDMARFRLNLPSYLPRLFLPLVPRPDLVIRLNGPPEVLYERKQEIPLQEINRQLGALESLSTLFCNVHEVRVDQPLDKEVAEVENLIINELEKRLKKRLGR